MITKEQWKEIENNLSSSFGQVELLIDGFNVLLAVMCVKPRKYEIVTYVNGWVRGEFMSEGSDEGRRFYRPVTKFIWSEKERAQFIKIYGGKRCPKEKLADFNKSITVLHSNWTNVTAMRRHFEKNNNELSVVRIGLSP
ncbi:hypothetical protein [Undibacterium danionis]|uniref:Uncharacterized protein n=1 Tax=Undibacterium danionis TaxID=1812100 RepID=A0ABV6IDY3_9BURK